MRRSSPTPSSHTKMRNKGVQQSIAKELRIVIGAALFAAASVGVWIAWEQLFPIPPEQLVKVYRVHGCRCVFDWVKSLEAEGFTVKLSEMQTLEYVRAAMHMPTNLHGCHVAGYLDYFVEGHVAPEALRKLAREHPAGIGVMTQTTLTATATHVGAYRDDNSPVLLLRTQQQPQLWFDPDN